MKKLFLIVMTSLAFHSARAQLLTEHFSYGNGNLGAAGIGDSVWTGGDSASSSIAVNTNAALTYSGLFGATGSGVVFSGGTFKKKAAPFTAQSGNGTTVYVSFLLNIQTAGSGVKLIAYLQNGNSASSSPPLGVFLNGTTLGLAKSASTPPVTTTLAAGTHLIVARYTFQSGNDQVDLWVDPASFGTNGTPAATLTTGTGTSSDAAELSYVFLNHAVSQTVWLDELRVGNTWAEVTPTDGSAPPPPPPPPAPGTAPRFTRVMHTPAGIVLHGTNGTANQSHHLVTSTNLLLPQDQWSVVGTNFFDGSGNFNWTNPLSFDGRPHFFLIRTIGGTNQPPVAPAITGQPQSQTAGTGSNVTFTVAATGTAPLGYQWRFNGASAGAGATAASLTLTNVSTNNAGSYSVVVSNVAGSVTSSVAVLTVAAPPPPAPPSILTQPQGQTVVEGQGATFSVVAGGDAPLRYQWFFSTNSPLADQTNASLTINAVSTNDAGVYSVVVTNNLGSTNSAFATLTVLPPPTNSGSSQIIQAEDGTFTGTVDTQHAGYTGPGFVNTVNAAGSYIEWEFGVQNTGSEMLVVRYAHGTTDDRTASLTVNGSVVNGSFAFPPTGAYTTWETVSNAVPLVSGRNVIRLTALNSPGLANTDRIEVTGAPQYKLKTMTVGGGSVSMSPTNAYAYFNPGTVVTLTAIAPTTGVFLAWSGALSGSNNPDTVVVDTNKTVTATFSNSVAPLLYVSPTGNDSNPGTIGQPLYSLHLAATMIESGGIIYMRGGTYSYSSTVLVDKPGTSNNPISILNYPGEQPILDYSTWVPANETIRGAARGIKVTTNAQYWLLKGLEIQYAPDNGIKSEGGHITFEQCVFHHNGDTGLQIGLNKDTFSTNPNPDYWAAYNVVINCDAYRNADPATSYENADGIDVKLYAGKGNQLIGCRAWENCDDGYDCYQTEWEITFEDCWAWHNGDPTIWGFTSFSGDGNGFKLGGDNTFCPMTLKNCVALDCLWGTTVGFAFNNNTAPITLYNCSALNCGRPYKFEQNGNVFKNCLDLNSTRPAPIDITGTSTQESNSWQLAVTVTSADFASVSDVDAAAPRQADGSLPNNNFARLVAGSDLIDKGVDVGLPYNGVSPDLGAFEFGTATTNPPSITTQPTNQTVTVGQSASFSVGANGTAPLSYQWYFNTAPLASGTSATYAINSATTNDAGSYSVIVTNVAGAATSVVATLTVNLPTPPSITTQPTNQTVGVGQTASFTIAASGTAPLRYQWYFNNGAMSGQTNASLSLSNVQTNQSGSYQAIVTNVAGSATSSVAALTVTNITAPPTITAQPQNQTVTESGNASFSITATGTTPLRYQWFFNTNTPLANGTNATFAVNGATTNDAGVYSVQVTNVYGATNSAFATLTVNPSNNIDFSHVGFGNNGVTVTGGAGGPTVYVGSEAELQSYSDVNAPYVIYITNSFNLTSMDTHIRDNKTVIGVGNVVLSGGGLYLYDATNVIIRNLTITGSTEDNIGIHFSANLWIDHCTLTDSTDGNIDITQQSDNITISWCRFYYTANAGHNFVNLIGSSDSDAGNYRVTFHHNWWDTLCAERMPSVRFGRAHVFNNYYNAPGNNYCARTRKEAEVRVENNFYQSVQNPWEQYITSSGDTQGKLFAADNNVPFLGTSYGVTWTGSVTNGDGTIRVMVPGTDTVFTAPYSYTPDAALQVPNIVTNNCGAGKGPFAP